MKHYSVIRLICVRKHQSSAIMRIANIILAFTFISHCECFPFEEEECLEEDDFDWDLITMQARSKLSEIQAVVEKSRAHHVVKRDHDHHSHDHYHDDHDDNIVVRNHSCIALLGFIKQEFY